MQSLIAGLPPEVARRIHPDWQKNEAEYWAHPDELLPKYRDQWIGFANGRVIVSGSSPVEVFHKAQESGEHPFVTCVGHEHEPSRMRRASFSYDTTYPGKPLPVMTLEFRKDIRSPGVVFDRVIVDTGADASALPWSDCKRLELDPRDGAPGLMGGGGETVKAAYGTLYTEVSRLLREADPIRLIVIGAPDDEYDPEVSTILPRLREAKSPDDVQRIVHEEFAHWFGAEIAGSAAQYAAVSKNIWEAWNKFPVST